MSGEVVPVLARYGAGLREYLLQDRHAQRMMWQMTQRIISEAQARGATVTILDDEILIEEQET